MLHLICHWYKNEITKLASKLRLAIYANDEEARLHHYLMFSFVGAPLMAIFAVYNTFQQQWLAAILLTFSLILMPLGWFARATIFYKAFVRYNCLNFLVIVLFLTYIGYDNGAEVTWLQTFPLLSIFMLGHKEGALWSILCILATTAILFIPPHYFTGWDPYQYPSPFSTRFVLTVTIISWTTYYFEFFRSLYRMRMLKEQQLLKAERENLQQEIAERKQLEEQLKQLAQSDSLTGICNRRYFRELFIREKSRLNRIDGKLMLLMIDVDRFKEINDTYGHAVGDCVLKNVAKICSNEIRSVDLLARIGGEEFVLLLPDTNRDQAMRTAQRICKRIHSHQFSCAGSAKLLAVSISVGVTEVQKHDEGIDPAFRRADSAMYLAKRNGRNRVESFFDEPPYSMTLS